ncbi:MAG: ABC transporter permease, partial [Richelia sp. SM2_1_7]|nr:ABC transporter permease [Richelia sp. SM2_1_7]
MDRNLRQLGFALTILFLLMPVMSPALQNLGILADPNQFLDNPIHAAPSWQHWFGTDQWGRDIFSRVIVGTRISLSVGVVAVMILISVGGAGRGLAGYYHRLDGPLMRFVDILMS